MLNSETITAIMPAFIKAKSAFKPAVKDAVNGAFSKGTNPKPSYVTLAQSIDSVDEALRKNGIALVQQTDVTESGSTILITRLIHESGEWIASRYPVHPVKNDPQGEGSALTYARRYALMSLVGIAPEDDDGNAATAAATKNNERDDADAQTWIDAINGADTLESLDAMGAELAAARLGAAAKAKIRGAFSARKHKLKEAA